jgi:hypothetical protein
VILVRAHWVSVGKSACEGGVLHCGFWGAYVLGYHKRAVLYAACYVHVVQRESMVRDAVVRYVQLAHQSVGMEAIGNTRERKSILSLLKSATQVDVCASHFLAPRVTVVLLR